VTSVSTSATAGWLEARYAVIIGHGQLLLGRDAPPPLRRPSS
jgi:hypothetical protein